MENGKSTEKPLRSCINFMQSSSSALSEVFLFVHINPAQPYLMTEVLKVSISFSSLADVGCERGRAPRQMQVLKMAQFYYYSMRLEMALLNT